MRCLAVLLVAVACGPSPAQRSTQGYLDRGDAAGAARAAVGDRAAANELATATLALGLRADAPRVQVAAVGAIERREIEDLAVDVARLLGAEDDRVRAAAAAALLRSHPDAPDVCNELLEAEDAEARATCASAFGRKFGDPARDDVPPQLRARARAVLVPLLVDRAARVRRVAILAVDRLADPSDTPRLVALAGRDPDGVNRAAALRAVIDRGASIDLGRAALRDAELGVRLAGIEILAARGADDELAALAVGPDLQLALHAAAARFAASGSSGRAVLERALSSPAWPVRAAALNVATQAAPSAELLALAGRAIIDPRVEVRLAAAGLLLRLGQSERAVAELRAALAAPSADLRLDAAAQLGRLGDAAGLDLLSRLAGSTAAAIRSAAIAAHATARRITPGLILAMASPDPLDRIAAAELVLELER